MSYSEKLTEAKSLIESHNSLIENTEDKISYDTFVKKLQKMGGTSEESLIESSWEDLQDCGLPKILARKIASVFRFIPKTTTVSTYSLLKRVAMLSPEELIKNYNPKTPNEIHERLRLLSKGQKFIIFNGKSVDVENSLKLLNEIIDGYEGRDIYYIDGNPTKTYVVGETTGEWVDQNPIYPNRPLRPDGTCDQLNRSWNGVSLKIRQLIYIASNITREASNEQWCNLIMNSPLAHKLMDIALSTNAEEQIKKLYPKSVIRFNEFEESDSLPKLRMKINDIGKKKVNDPFFSEGSK